MSKEEIYKFENNEIVIEDQEIGISMREPFNPLYIDLKRQNFPAHFIIKKIENNEGILQEAFFEKEGLFEGQRLSYYPSGNIKMETFYEHGKLHGPSTFFDNDGMILSRAWYVKGLQQGKSYWYYNNRVLYSIQRFLDGQWQGKQEYYYQNGSPKTIAFYNQGILINEARLFSSNGEIVKVIKSNAIEKGPKKRTKMT